MVVEGVNYIDLLVDLISPIAPITLPPIIGAILKFLIDKVQHHKTYTELDNLYFEALKLGMQDSRFRDYDYTSSYKTRFSGGDRIRYETYAYIMWNICETAYDNTRKDASNKKTWEPIIREENRLHRAWFRDSTTVTNIKFKTEFVAYVRSLDNTNN